LAIFTVLSIQKMQFKHPEILYFLALLLIPILVHLFQLQRFQKTMFTNVAFLQKISSQTRKSSRIKKWLVLLTRLTLLAAIIFAFAQPYFSNNTINQKQHQFIYLDNSLSTNAKGSKGNLLQVASQELIENLDKDISYSLLTNDNFHQNITNDELKDILFKVENSSSKTALNEVFLKADNNNKKLKNTNTKTLLISDFQNNKSEEINNKNEYHFIQHLPEQKDNLAIDSVYVSSKNNNTFSLKAIIKNEGEAKTNVPIAISNSDKLISKQTFDIEANDSKTIDFIIQKDTTFLGKITIKNNDTFNFDNTFYFTLNTNPKTNVLAIGNNNAFLSKIYTEEEFNFTNNTPKNINFNVFDQQQLVVLNEVDEFSPSLISSLSDFSKNGGQIIIVPSINSDVKSYNLLLKNLGYGAIENVKKDTLKITNINFSHPVFKDVFQKKVSNFQYPDVKNYYPSSFINESIIISFENNQGFIKQIKNLFWVAAPLNKKNSNFTNSPLIVPVFYNIGQQSLQLSKLYYTVNQENSIDVKTKLNKDGILAIQNETSSFIPLQQNRQSKVSLQTKEQPQHNGFYHILQEKDTIQSIAFNYPKSESSLQYLDVKSIADTNENITFSNSVKDSISEIKQKNKVHWLWKWFLILAIVSLLIEILILKFFKV